jgi:ATP-binding cassette, subfamily B, bacterial
VRQRIRKLVAFFRDWETQSKYLRWMTSRTKLFAGPLALLLLLDVLSTLLGVGGTVISKYLIDGATCGGAFKGGIWMLATVTMVSIGLFAAVNLLSTLISERYAFGIRSKLFERILHSHWHAIVSCHSEDLMTRLTSDVDSVANGISSLAPGIILMVVRLVSAFLVLFYYDHVLALVALVLGPAGVLVSLLMGDRLKRLQTELKESESVYRAFMQESVANITVVKAFERETACQAKLSELRDQRLRLILRRNRTSTMLGMVMRLVFSLGYLLAFGWGIYRLSNGSITYGTMTVFLSLVSQVQGPMMSMAQMIPQFISVLASTGRIMEVEAQQEEPRLAGCSLPGRIGLRTEQVDFMYDREPVLSNVWIDIRPGDVVGLVGHSGSGKTTLVRLILALVQPQCGRVMFYSEASWEEATAASRRLISYVPQGNSLSSGTIAENLRTGKQNASQTEMWEALEIAGVSDFVRCLPHGLDTVIQERSGGLSEGQAQRVAIARAVLKDAPFMILDEATSALDDQTEATVLSRLCASNRIHTCIIITHRKTMLRYCNRALEIADTCVREYPIPTEYCVKSSEV